MRNYLRKPITRIIVGTALLAGGFFSTYKAQETFTKGLEVPLPRQVGALTAQQYSADYRLRSTLKQYVESPERDTSVIGDRTLIAAVQEHSTRREGLAHEIDAITSLPEYSRQKQETIRFNDISNRYQSSGLAAAALGVLSIASGIASRKREICNSTCLFDWEKAE